MLDIYYVTFAGHREIDHFHEVEDKLYEIVCDLIRTNEYVEFYVGNNGEFDIMATSAVRRARRSMGDHNSALNLVLPYPKTDMEYMENSFDTIIIPDKLHGVHPKNAITARNQWMVQNSNLLICYVTRATGGAARTLKEARKNDVSVRNIADEMYE